MMPPAVPNPEVPAVNRKEFGFGKSDSGQDAVILFGKAVPVPIAVAVVGGAGALLLFLRAKASGSNVISAGTQPAATTASSTAYDPDAQAIADLQNALTSMSSQIQGLTPADATAAATTTPAPTPVAAAPSSAVSTAPSAAVTSVTQNGFINGVTAEMSYIGSQLVMVNGVPVNGYLGSTTTAVADTGSESGSAKDITMGTLPTGPNISSQAPNPGGPLIPAPAPVAPYPTSFTAVQADQIFAAGYNLSDAPSSLLTSIGM
jgi:hypothetical protein